MSFHERHPIAYYSSTLGGLSLLETTVSIINSNGSFTIHSGLHSAASVEVKNTKTNTNTYRRSVMSTVPTQRRPIINNSTNNNPNSISSGYDTESPPSPTNNSALVNKNNMNNRVHLSSNIRTNPLNVYKADQERKGASFKIILFLAATTFYTAFLYSGAVERLEGRTLFCIHCLSTLSK